MADTADSRSTSHSQRGTAHESSPLKHTGSTAFCTECGAQKTLTSSQCFVFFLTLCFQFRRVPIHLHRLSVMHASTHTQRSPSSTRRYWKNNAVHMIYILILTVHTYMLAVCTIPTPDGPLGSIPPQPGTRNPVLRRPHAPCLHPRPSPRPALGQLHRSTSRVCCRSFRCNHV